MSHHLFEQLLALHTLESQRLTHVRRGRPLPGLDKVREHAGDQRARSFIPVRSFAFTLLNHEGIDDKVDIFGELV